jgi:hypothetical protein
MAPNLYNMAYFKWRTVAKELLNNNWIYAIHHISTTQELLEFINMWVVLKNIRLSQEENDTLIWNRTSNGDYTAASTYKIQFQGSHASCDTPCL